MIFNIRKASTRLFEEERDIQTIDDLKKLAAEFAEPGNEFGNEFECLILDFNKHIFKDIPEITIYDDYIE